MKLRLSLICGAMFGLACLGIATHTQTSVEPTAVAQIVGPIPICPVDKPDCADSTGKRQPVRATSYHRQKHR